MTKIERQLLINQRIILMALLDLPNTPRDAVRHRIIKACGDTLALIEDVDDSHH